MQVFSLCRNLHFMLSTYLHMAFWRLRCWGQTVEIFTYLKDHVDPQKQPTLRLRDCLCSAKTHLLGNGGVGCHWTRSRAGVGGLWGCPGATWQHRQLHHEPGPCEDSCRTSHPPSHLMLIQTCSQILFCALNTKLRGKLKHLGSPPLNTQERGLMPPPRLHSSRPPAVPSAHPTDARLCSSAVRATRSKRTGNKGRTELKTSWGISKYSISTDVIQGTRAFCHLRMVVVQTGLWAGKGARAHTAGQEPLGVWHIPPQSSAFPFPPSLCLVCSAPNASEQSPALTPGVQSVSHNGALIWTAMSRSYRNKLTNNNNHPDLWSSFSKGIKGWQ